MKACKSRMESDDIMGSNGDDVRGILVNPITIGAGLLMLVRLIAEILIQVGSAIG